MFKQKDKDITISEILRGTSAGKMQTVGYMQVIPLISDYEDHNIGSPVGIEFSTSDYGSMAFNNNSDKLVLIPCHAGYVVKLSAQDHAMAQLGLIQSKKKRVYKNAMCIQQSQGGYIKGGQYDMLILPVALREKALKKRKDKSYNKLWEDISQFNKLFGLSGGGHLEYFLKKYEKELAEFVAEFECVPKQVGAIILINGQVYGIERSPSYSFWKSIWPALIRECYGSSAIEVSAKLGTKGMSKLRTPLRKTGINNLSDLKTALKQADNDESDKAKSHIRDLIEDPFNREKEEDVSGYNLETLNHSQFNGQMVRNGEQIVYASLTVKEKWKKNGNWLKSKPFSI